MMIDIARGQSAHSMPSELSLTVVVLTFNEALHLERCLASVLPFASDILVVDSFSDDETVKIANSFGAKVIQNKFINQSKQFQWALDKDVITTDWIMRLDADEIIEPDLASKLRVDLYSLPRDVAGVRLQRKHIFMDRWIRHGGRFPLELVRVWRRGQGVVEDRWMDEHIVVSGGRVVGFKGGFADINLNDLTYFTAKHNHYATREAIDRLVSRYELRGSSRNGPTGSSQARLKRWLKEELYNRLPFWIGPLAYFLYRYTIQLGFLDGRQGLIYHFLQGFWYRFLVGAKLVELERAMAVCLTREERAKRLAEITGLTLQIER